MTDHLTHNQVEEYYQRKLSPAQLLAVSDHMSTCEACRRQVESIPDADVAFLAIGSEVFGDTETIASASAPGEHLTAAQTANYVDASLSDEQFQLVADHVASCEQCALAVDDLREFKANLAPELEREPVRLKTAGPVRGFSSRLTSYVSLITWRFSPLAIGAATLLLLLAFAGWLIWRSPKGGGSSQEAVIAPPKEKEEPVPVVARLVDGEEGMLALDRDGKLSGGDRLPAEYQNMIKEALKNNGIEVSPVLKNLNRPPSPLMGPEPEGNRFSVIEPVRKVLLIDRPTFRWSVLNGATGYVVEVYDAKFNLVEASPQVTGHSWSVSRALARDRTYTWQVKAIKDGNEFKAPRPPAPEATFHIVDAATANELSRSGRDYASFHLALGLLYAKAGLIDEAQKELRSLEQANPDSQIVRKLLAELGAARH